VIIAHQICDDPDVTVVYGNQFSTVMLATEEIYHDCGIPALCHAQMPTIVEKGYENIFQHTPNVYIFANGFADAAQQVTGIKSVAIMHDKDAFQQGFAEAFRDRCNEIGIEITSYQGVTADAPDYSAVLTKIKGEDPDALFRATVGASRMLIPKQMKELGMRQKDLVVEAYQIASEYLAGAGEAGVGTLSVAASPPSGHPRDDIFQEWATTFEAKYGNKPDPEHIWHYQATKVLADAIERAGSTDKQAIIAALRETDYPGPAYDVAFNEKGGLKGGMLWFWEVKPGPEFEAIAEYDARAAKWTSLE
jgi:branched-chain amino acid transport system substrate-binding protein